MARMRIVKPEFWTSEQVVECSRDARLLFIGLWNFCDDHGVHPLSFKRIKMQVFPADEDITSESIRRMILELSENGLIATYEVDNKEFLIVTGWKSHQRIDKPTYKYPRPFEEDSKSTLRVLDDHSGTDRKGKERKGKEKHKGFELPEWVNSEAWAEFEAHRKAIKKPMTDQARALNAGKLEGLTQETQALVINRTIENRWTGLFPPKQEHTDPYTLPNGELVVM